MICSSPTRVAEAHKKLPFRGLLRHGAEFPSVLPPHAASSPAMDQPLRITRANRRVAPVAFSLLEVVLASALCAAALVPALVIIRDSIARAREIDIRHQLLLYGVGTLEAQLAAVAALDSAWPGAAPSPGSFASEGHPDMRYTVTWSDNPANGGLTNRLMNVTVTTYYDEDGDGSQDAGEPAITLNTKIGKFASYENKAEG